MGLFDLDMSTPQGQGFNNALLAAAQALLTPRSRGGGMGAAFGAFPQAIDRAKANAMREQLMALQGKQVGLQTDKLGFDMEQARAQQEAARARQAQFAQLVGGLPPDQQGIAQALGPDYFKGLAPQAPKPEEPSAIGKLVAERDKFPEGHPLRRVYDDAIAKATTHAPAAQQTVYTGTMIPAEVGGKPSFVMPSRDGSVRVLEGLEPPGSAAKREAAATEATTARDFVGLIDMALEHPGRETSTGLSGVLDPRNYLPGSNARSYKAIHKQLEGKAFLNAYQSLKGGGPITDIEGRKSTEASIRLDTAQSDEEYEAALREARQLIAERYKKSTGKELPAAPGGQSHGKSKVPTISSDADYNALPSGAEFIAPDGSRRRKP
jgi:hypothetical protein